LAGRQAHLKSVPGLQHLSGAFSDDDARSHRVSDCNAWHDGSVGNAKSVNSINLEVGIDDGHVIPSHLCGTRLMPVCTGGVADEVFQIRTFEIARHDLPLCKLLHWRGVSDVSAYADAGNGCLHVVGMGQEVGFDLKRIIRVRAGKPDSPSALCPFQTSE
jgi:hypothetical protein